MSEQNNEFKEALKKLFESLIEIGEAKAELKNIKLPIKSTTINWSGNFHSESQRAFHDTSTLITESLHDIGIAFKNDTGTQDISFSITSEDIKKIDHSDL